MTDRPILRLPDAGNAQRRTEGQGRPPKPSGPGREAQGRRFQRRFDELNNAIRQQREGIVLRDDPSGIAPDRALVFEVGGAIQDFAKAARKVGLELISEEALDALDEIPDGFTPPGGTGPLPRTLYTTMPTLTSANKLLSLWSAYRRGESPETGITPWWRLFDLLLTVRTWGPSDRFPIHAREIISQRLPDNDEDEVRLELEIWPSKHEASRTQWRDEAIAKVQALGGRVIDRSALVEGSFIYDALLIDLSAGEVRALIDDPFAPVSLAWVRGVQLILPQTVCQAFPYDVRHDAEIDHAPEPFDPEAPIRAACFDTVPVAAHPALDGGVVIEDVHDLVPLTPVGGRSHATSMASLILRGDLEQDGAPLRDSRLVSVPVMIDSTDGRAVSPRDRLFVDVIHTALARLFVGENAAAPDVFVINLSIGVPEMRFAGRVSALARLLDWWSSEYGVLFVVSTGNVWDDVVLSNMPSEEFKSAGLDDQGRAVANALRDATYGRTLFAPAETLNGLTVGAASTDLFRIEPPIRDDVVRLETDGECLPAVSSAVGLGPQRAIKPDVLNHGGIHELRVLPPQDSDDNATRLRVVMDSGRYAGLTVASPDFAMGPQTRRTIGTSCAAALTTREILKAAHALVSEGGPYEGQELPRGDLALLTRALAVNSARWPDPAGAMYRDELERFGSSHSLKAKESVARYYGHGMVSADWMHQSPEQGVTMVGLGEVRKDGARMFHMPLPPSIAGERLSRSMHVTLAWFSPVDINRASYRLASLEAIASNSEGGHDEAKDTTWRLALGSDGPDERMIKRGTIWSRRLKNNRATVPGYDGNAIIPIRVQCRDASGGGLSPDVDIRFAIVVTLVVEASVQFDIYQEVREAILVRQRSSG